MPTAAEVAEFDTEELEHQLDETRRELFNLRFQLATGQLENFNRIKQVKQDVARMLTELRSREIAEAEGLALEALPSHRAAAKRRSAEDAAGLDHSSPDERRRRRRAEAEAEAAEADAQAEAAEDEVAETEVGDTDEADVDDATDAEQSEEDA